MGTEYRTVRSLYLVPTPYAEDSSLIVDGMFGAKPPTVVQMRRGEERALVLVHEGKVVPEGALRACQVCNDHPGTKRTWISFGLSVPGATELARELVRLKVCEPVILYEQVRKEKKEKKEA